MRYVAPEIDEGEARRRLRPRRGCRWRLGSARESPLSAKRLPHLELVWLPFLHVSAGQSGCVVCASTGLASRLAIDGLSSVDGDGVIEPAIARERLVEIARSHLSRLDAWAGGAGTDAAERPLTLEDWALPFWVLHFERRPGRLDFVALDGLGGAKVGGAVRQALLRAMLARPG